VSVGSSSVRLGACAGEDGFLRMRTATTRVDVSPGVADGAGRVRMECDARAARLRHLFEVPITRALGERSGRYLVQLREGRGPRELLAVISVPGRRVPLTLFFPDAETLTAADVERIVHSVLEGMGTLFP
jgi:hypothetical protein